MALFKEFKRNVPVMGAILLDARMEHVLLVRGYKGASCWGFPRGKIMKDESDADCAVREVGACKVGGRKPAARTSGLGRDCSGAGLRVRRPRSEAARPSQADVFARVSNGPCSQLVVIVAIHSLVIVARFWRRRGMIWRVSWTRMTTLSWCWRGRGAHGRGV